MNVEEAYAAARALHERRLREGWLAAGRKIGFTNRTIWPIYGVYEPIWGFVYRETLIRAQGGRAVVPLAGLQQPRIEPEVCFGLKRAPRSSEPGELLASLEWVAHAIEIVHCQQPGWKGVTVASSTAENGLHGRLVLGAPRPIPQDMREALPCMEMVLRKEGTEVDRGIGENVLGSPLLALGYLVDLLARQPGCGLAAGEVVTTGTLTDAHPVRPGERWSTAVRGFPLDGLEVEFR